MISFQKKVQSADPSLKPADRKDAKLITHLPYWELDDGVLELRNRVLEVGVQLHLPDSDFMGDETLLDLADTYSHVLRSVTAGGERARMIIETVTAQHSNNPIPSYLEQTKTEIPLLQDLARSRADAIQAEFDAGFVRETNLYVTLTLSDFKATGLQPFYLDEWPKAVARAHDLRSRLLNAFTSIGIKAETMDSQAVFALIWRFLNPGLHPAPAPIYKPLHKRVIKTLSRKAVQTFPELAVDTLRAQLTSSEIDNENPAFLRVGGKYLASLSMTGLPDQTVFSRINRVLPVSGSSYVLIDVQHPVQAKAQSRLINQAKFALGMTQGMNRAGGERQADAVHAMQAEERHIMKVGFTALMLADAREELNAIKRDVLSELQMMSGMRVAADGFDTLEQFMACLPFSGRSSRHARTTFDDTARNLMPTKAAWRGSRNPISVFGNRHGGLVPFDAFDERSSGKHMIVLGGTRSGKSFGSQALTMDQLRSGVQLAVLDRGNSWDQLVQAAGGSVTTIDPGASSINPFDLQPGVLEPDPSSAGVMANIMQGMLGETSSDERSLIPHAIAQAFSLSHYETGERTSQELVLLSSVVKRLENMNRIGDRPMTGVERDLALALARRLQGWIGNTPLGSFVDRPSSFDLSSGVMSFETLRLKDNPQLQAVTMMMLSNLLLRWITKDSSQRKRIVVEELKAMMDTPAAIDTTAMLFSTAAKYNAAMTVINQGASLFDEPSTRGILENASFYLFFRMTDPRDIRILQERLSLSDAMAGTIQGLQSVPGHYSEALAIIRRDDAVLEGGVVRIQTSPLEYWTYTSSPDDKVRRERALEQFAGNQRAALWELASDWKVI